MSDQRKRELWRLTQGYLAGVLAGILTERIARRREDRTPA